MPTQACHSQRSRVRRRKEGSERAVLPSGRPLRPARIRPNPPNSGQMARFPSKTALQSAVEAVRRPSPLPPPLPPGRPSNTAPKVPSLDEDPLQPLNFKPVTRPQRPFGPPLSSKVIGIRWTPVIVLSEPVLGIVGMRSSRLGSSLRARARPCHIEQRCRLCTGIISTMRSRLVVHTSSGRSMPAR